MTRVAVEGAIAAPPEVVFRAVTDMEHMPELDEEVVGVEFLTEQRTGVGTRFRETRSWKGREMVTELEVTEYIENERARMVADTHGTVWDTVFTVKPTEAGCTLEIAMDARPHKLVPRIMNPLMKGFFRRGIEGHVKKVRAHCERVAGASPP